MHTAKKYSVILFAICSAAAFAVAPPPATAPEAPVVHETTATKNQAATTNTQIDTSEKTPAPTNPIKPPHKVELVEGK